MTRGSNSSAAALARRRTIRGSISVRAEALVEEILSETRKPFVPYPEVEP